MTAKGHEPTLLSLLHFIIEDKIIGYFQRESCAHLIKTHIRHDEILGYFFLSQKTTFDSLKAHVLYINPRSLSFHERK